MRIGYARVSTKDQKLAVQLEQLTAAGCEYIYQEKVSGKDAARVQLKRLLSKLRPRDVVVVAKLDRLARSTPDLLALAQQIADAEAGFVSLGEPWADTTSPAGKLILTVFAGVAQFELERMLERCNDGRRAAKQKGVKFGRKPVLTPAQAEHATKLLGSGTPLQDVAAVLKVSTRTVYRFRRILTVARQSTDSSAH